MQSTQNSVILSFKQSDMGVGPFEKMDPWEMSELLGVDKLQPEDQIRLAAKGGNLKDVHE